MSIFKILVLLTLSWPALAVESTEVNSALNKVCGSDKALHASEYKLTAMDRLVLCQGSEKDKLSEKQKVHLKTGRTSLPLMSELLYISAAKKEVLCFHDESKESDCALLLSTKKAEVLISHLMLPSLDASARIDCNKTPCKVEKKCSVQTPISTAFRKHKLADFKKTIQEAIVKLNTYQECRRKSKDCDMSLVPKVDTYTLDEQLALQNLALKEDSTNAETLLNWLSVGKNCKGTCLNAADFFDEYNCKY
jgi:hypothetical protein